MEIGDLVQVKKCPDNGILCSCFFCHHDSSCVGLVKGPATFNRWSVLFDCGEWELADDEAEVISKSIELTDDQLENVCSGMEQSQFDSWRCRVINEGG